MEGRSGQEYSIVALQIGRPRSGCSFVGGLGNVDRAVRHKLAKSGGIGLTRAFSRMATTRLTLFGAFTLCDKEVAQGATQMVEPT